MKTSESISEITAALAKAQASMRPAVNDSDNPHFKSKYASMSAIVASVRGPLGQNGLAFLQFMNGDRLATRLLHESGEWIEDDDGVPVIAGRGDGHQSFGSGLTYARRYGLSTMLGIVTDEEFVWQRPARP